MPDSEFSVRETADRLRQSLDTVEWAVRRIPPAYTRDMPDGSPTGEWSAAMNLAHLIVYDEEIANPVLASLAEAGATKSHLEQWFQPEAEAMAPDPIAALAGRFATAHKRHIEIVESFSDGRFNTPVTPFFTRGETLRAGLDRHEDVSAHMGARECAPPPRAFRPSGIGQAPVLS
jgi:hypothetical protein